MSLQKPSEGVSTLAYIRTDFSEAGSLRNGYVCASKLNPCKLVVCPASVDWEACLSKNEITAGSKLFACVVSPAQPCCFSSFQSEIVGKSHACIG